MVPPDAGYSPAIAEISQTGELERLFHRVLWAANPILRQWQGNCSAGTGLKKLEGIRVDTPDRKRP
jgi:hypothetical protein